MSDTVARAEMLALPQDRRPRLPPYMTRAGRIHEVTLPYPPIGGKCWVMDLKGTFLLERGPGLLRTCACTHIGSGSIAIYDGLPNENGEFPDEKHADDDDAPLGTNGRPLFRANPSVMGSWMLDAGFVHGLTARSEGGSGFTATIASIVWLPARPPR